MRLIKEKHEPKVDQRKRTRRWEETWRTKHGEDQTKRIKFKGPRFEKRPNMKQLKEKKRTERLQRRSTTPNTHKEHAKRIKNTKRLGRGLKPPSVHGKHAKRIENTKRMLIAHNKDQ